MFTFRSKDDKNGGIFDIKGDRFYSGKDDKLIWLLFS